MASPETLHYKKRAGTTGIAGQRYEVKMCSVVFLRSIRDGEFYLASNVEGAGAFDDIGLRVYTDDQSTRISLVQLKHTVKTVTRGKLLSRSKTNKYGLLKYYLSYKRDVKPRFLDSKCNDPLFGSSIDDLTLVFYTNASISGMPGTSGEQDDILNTGRNGCIYRFNKDRDQDVWDVWNEWSNSFSDLGDIAEYEEFLSKLVLYSKQATESELDGIIKMELRDIFNVTPKIADVLLPKFLTQLQYWWESDDVMYLKENCALWDGVIEETINMVNDHIKQEIGTLDFRFSDQAVLQLLDMMGESRVVLCLVNSKNTRLSVCKVVQALERDLHQFVLGSSEAALGFWQSRCGSILVLAGKDCTPSLLTMCLSELERYPRKKLLVVSHENNQEVVSYLHGFEPSVFCEFFDKVNLLCLDSPSIHNVLSKYVDFQGHKIFLKDLLNCDPKKEVDNKIVSLLQSLEKLLNVFVDSRDGFKMLEKFNTDTIFNTIRYLIKNRKISIKSNTDTVLFVKLHEQELELATEIDKLSVNLRPLRDFIGIVSLIEKFKMFRKDVGQSKNSQGLNNDRNLSHIIRLLNSIPKDNDISQVGVLSVSGDTLEWLWNNGSEIHKCLQRVMSRNKVLVKTILQPIEDWENRFKTLDLKKLQEISKTLTNFHTDNPIQLEKFYRYMNSTASLDKLSTQVINDAKYLGTIASELTLMESVNADILLSLMKDETICMGVTLENPITYYIPRSLKRESVVKVEKATDLDDRVVVIAAEPGMGKTTLLTHVAQQSKSKEPSTWVMVIALNRMTSYLKSIQAERITKHHAFNLLLLAGEVKSSFEKMLLGHMLNYTGRVMVFLDGFDELYPHYEHTMFSIITELQLTKMGKLWISSRPYMKSYLEECATSDAFDIVEFSQEDQICFFRKVWSERFINMDEMYLSIFIHDVIRQMSQSISGTERSFMDIPLQASIVAETLDRELAERHTRGKWEPVIFNIIDLYDRFFRKKCYIYFEEKEGIDTTKPGFITECGKKIKEIEEYHENIALHLYLSTKELISLNIEILQGKYLIDYEQRWACIGIVTLIDGITVFSHKTVGEYFVAKWISGHYQNCRNFILKKLFTVEYSVVREFLDKILSSGFSLHLHVQDGNVNIIEKTVDVVSVNERDRGGRTPLHLAVMARESKEPNPVIELLLNNGADFNIPDHVLGYSVLEYIELTNNLSALDMIIKKSSHIQKFQFLKRSKSRFVEAACVNGYLEILRYLVRHGYDMCKRVDDFDRTPLHIACMWCQLNVVKYLLCDYRRDMSIKKRIIKQRIQVNARDCSKRTALHFACEKGRKDIARLLIDMGSKVDKCDDNNYTPLHLAAKNGHFIVARFLVEARCNLNARTKSNLTPLHLAAQSGNTEILKFLIHRGCNSTARNSLRQTALHIAARLGYDDATSFLIQAGCEVNVRDHDSQTPLHLSVMHGHVHITRLLIGAGCQVDICDDYKRTPLHYAAEKGRVDNVRLLIEAGCKVNASATYSRTPLHLAIEEGNVDIVKYLIQSGSKVNRRDSFSQTPLHFAIIEGNVDIARFLIESNCTVDTLDIMNKTPLQLAISEGQVDIVRLLIESGCEVDFRNVHNQTPLHFALEKGDLDIATLLIESGCTFVTSDEFEATPKNSAIQKVLEDIVRRLSTSKNLERSVNIEIYPPHYETEEDVEDTWL